MLRTHSEAEFDLPRKDDPGTVFHGEEELPKGMAGHVQERFAQQAAKA